jgi:hypothetical protein
MTEEESAAMPPAGMQQEVLESGGDPLLMAFASAVHRSDGQMDITLNVRGTTITGTLIGRDKWMDELAARMSEAGEAARSVGEALQTVFREMDEEQPPEERRDFNLYLRDARLITGGALIPNAEPGMLWRGRISEISGWSMGRFKSL